MSRHVRWFGWVGQVTVPRLAPKTFAGFGGSTAILRFKATLGLRLLEPKVETECEELLVLQAI